MIVHTADRRFLRGAVVQGVRTEEGLGHHPEGTAIAPEVAAVRRAIHVTAIATDTDVKDRDHMSVDDQGITIEITEEEIIQAQAKKNVKSKEEAPSNINKEIEMTIERGIWMKMWRCNKWKSQRKEKWCRRR